MRGKIISPGKGQVEAFFIMHLEHNLNPTKMQLGRNGESAKLFVSSHL